MLTVRYCDPDGGEIVFPVASVQKSVRKTGSSTTPHADVTFDRLPGSPGLLQVSSGCVYVMNDHGKTVAKYDLGPYGDVPWSSHATEPASITASSQSASGYVCSTLKPSHVEPEGV
jgi:hypothetical protein